MPSRFARTRRTHLADDPVEELRVVERALVPARRGARVAVHEEQLDVRGVPEGRAAHLAEPEHREARGHAGHAAGLAEPGRERPVREADGPVHDRLGERAQAP